MLKIETGTVINRPVEDVFAVVTDVENNPKWGSGLLEAIKTSDGPIGVGTTWRLVRKLLGQRLEAEGEVIEYELNRNYAIKGESPFPTVVRQAYEAVEGGTRVSINLEAEPGGFFKLAEPLLKITLKREIDYEFANLKDLMEAHAL